MMSSGHNVRKQAENGHDESSPERKPSFQAVREVLY